MKKMNLGVVFGSRSCEREVSVISAIQMTEGMTLEDTLKQRADAKIPVVKRALSELTVKSKKKGLFF